MYQLDLFDTMKPAPTARDLASGSNDYHHMPVSAQQLAYARRLSAEQKAELPEDVIADRHALTRWINTHQSALKSRFANYPSSKQVAFAERIARIKRREVPRECFHDKALMSRWIEGNK